jgi:hypothetical protein
MNNVKSQPQHPPTETATDPFSSEPVQLELFPRTFGGTAWLPESPIEQAPSREFCLPPSTPTATTTTENATDVMIERPRSGGAK